MYHSQAISGSGKQIRDFYQITIRVPEINRLNGAGRACALNRPLNDWDQTRLQMLHDFRKGRSRQKTQVCGTRCRPSRFRLKFLSSLMQIDLLRPKCQRHAVGAERNDLHTENICVKSAGGINVGYGQHQMVQTVKKEHKNLKPLDRPLLLGLDGRNLNLAGRGGTRGR